MSNLTPIPTTYRGIKFRSKLEARWAVFLDHCKIVSAWKYEPTIINGPGFSYTPDFLIAIQSFSWFLEVKPIQAYDGYVDKLSKISNSLGEVVWLGEGSFYQTDNSKDLPCIREIRPGHKSHYADRVPITDFPWFAASTASTKAAADLATRFRFDLAVHSYLPPHKNGKIGR